MITSIYNTGNDLPTVMEPLYYIQVEDIEAPLENKLRLLIDWGGLKALGRKGLKDLKGSKDLKNLKRLKGLEAMKGSQAGVKVARRKEHKPGSFFTRSQLLHFWRTNKRPERRKKMGRWTSSTKISGDGSTKKKSTESWSSTKKKNTGGWSAKKQTTGDWSVKESGGGGWSAKRAFGRFPERWSADSEESDWMEEEEEPLPEYQYSHHSHHSRHSHRSQHTQPLPEYQRSPPPSAEATQAYKYTSSTNAQRAAQQVRTSQFYKFSLPRYHHRLIS